MASAASPTAGTAREERKVVTILFADISGSTELGERLDPEAVRGLLSRHFADARAVLEHHGATVEKFIGDAVMAVFGIPVAHEDDALRAIRAATELLDSVARTNADSRASARLAIRIGVNTGEVVTGSGSGETLVTGDAVNTAARLEQAANPGEILIGAATLELVRDAIEYEPFEPIVARGKADPVPAFRVRRLSGDEGHRRRLDAPFLGREDELAALRDAFITAGAERRPKLVTVTATAGIGKSRLVSELAHVLLETATVATGRCLSYGDGITYWPVREVLLKLAGAEEQDTAPEVRHRVIAFTGDQPDLTGPLSSVIGLEAHSQRQDELFWAVRKALELVAAVRPLAIIVEDLHWADEALLNLLEYIVTTGRGPMLFVATSRPELLDARPSWAGLGVVLGLQPLPSSSAEELLDLHLGTLDLGPGLRERILSAADGNALFLEEMVGMIREDEGRLMDGGEGLVIPPTIHALLAARLDQLDPDERVVLEHASVIGQTFEASAVAAITTDGGSDSTAASFVGLVRRDLLQPDRADLTDGDAYRFRHILIRDAAYASLSKASRARLHERFAAWLDAAARDRVGEYEEIVAHHLERAVSYLEELGDGSVVALRPRLADWLLRAGLRAVARDDAEAAEALLRKAAAAGHGRLEVEGVAMRELSWILDVAGEVVASEPFIQRWLELAMESGDPVEEALARVRLLYFHRFSEPATWPEECEREVPGLVRTLERAGNDGGLAAAWHVAALAAWPDYERSRDAETRALAHARAAGDRRWLAPTFGGLAASLIFGPAPADEVAAALEEAGAELAGLGRGAEASVALSMSVLEAIEGRYDDAAARSSSAWEIQRELGARIELVTGANRLAFIHELGGRPERAEPALRDAITICREIGDQDFGPYNSAHLARCLAAQGRFEEARQAVAEATVDTPDDPVRDAFAYAAKGSILAAQGAHDAAVESAQRAVAGTEDQQNLRRTLLLMDLARVLRIAHREPEAGAALDEAEALARTKQNVAVLELIAGLRQ